MSNEIVDVTQTIITNIICGENGKAAIACITIMGFGAFALGVYAIHEKYSLKIGSVELAPSDKQ